MITWIYPIIVVVLTGLVVLALWQRDDARDDRDYERGRADAYRRDRELAERKIAFLGAALENMECRKDWDRFDWYEAAADAVEEDEDGQKTI